MKNAIIFSLVYMIVGIIMQTILNITNPAIYSCIYCLIGVVYGIIKGSEI